MTNSQASVPSPSPIEVGDVVRLPNRRLALVERVAGDSASDSESDSISSLSTSSSAGSHTDERGRLIRWVAGAAPATAPVRTHASGRALISSYSDSEGDGDDDDDEDRPQHDPLHLPSLAAQRPPRNLEDGQALVNLATTGERVVAPVAELVSLDRALDPGQVVMWASRGPWGPPAQSGIVEEVNRVALVRRVADIKSSTVETPDPTTLFEVPASRLGFFCGVRAGDTVVRGSWVGVIDHFTEDVYVEFRDGAIACVPGHRKALRNVDRRTPDRARPDPFSEGLYYPGQKVRSLPHVWESMAVWIRGNYTGIEEGVVKAVRVGEVGVEWIAKSFYAIEHDEDPIVDQQNRGVEVLLFSDITLLEAFRNLWWTTGDRGILLPEEDGRSDGAGRSATVRSGSSMEQGSAGRHDEEDENDDYDDGEWEDADDEDVDIGEDRETAGAGPSSATDVPPRLAVRSRTKRQGSRLMKAQRRARERSNANGLVGTVTDSAWATVSASPKDVVQVVSTRSHVTVLWQDGTRTENVPSLELRMNNHPDSYDFWPGEIVVKADDEFAAERADGAGGSGGQLPPLSQRKGAIVKVNQSERTAVVRWQREGQTPFDGAEEEVSVYELKTDEYDVNVGDTVLHLPKQATASGERRKEWVGVITKQHMGMCTVVWHGGKVSAVPSQDLLNISGGDEESYDEGGLSTSEGGSETGAHNIETESRAAYVNNLESENADESAYQHNWGTDDESDNEHPIAVYGKFTISSFLTSRKLSHGPQDLREEDMDVAIEKVVSETMAELEAKRFHNDGTLQRKSLTTTEERMWATKMTMQVLAELYSAVLRRPELKGERQNASRDSGYVQWERFIERMQAAYEKLIIAEIEWLRGRREPLREGDTDSMQISSAASEEESHAATNGFAAVPRSGGAGQHLLSSEEGSKLERFEMVESFKAFHSFPNVPSTSSFSTGFLSIVHKEWNRLRRNLATGVFVRVSESQCDRLRAGIIGAEGTPYADVMFFFDIRLGSNYPMAPPHVWFYAHGKRINPNLYEDGKVCLSILGTWDGDDVESWDAKTSNLLRVLLSLQALVFVEEPYYNEAGYSKQRGTEEGRLNSRIYNESAFLLCMRHVIHTLRVGGVPEDCAAAAQIHYRTAGPRILDRCRKLVNEESGAESGYSSAGFRKSLGQLLKPLETALSKVCGD